MHQPLKLLTAIAGLQLARLWADQVQPEGMGQAGADVACCDVLQVWLDVAAHPSRGEQQAELIYRKVLRPVVEGPGQ